MWNKLILLLIACLGLAVGVVGTSSRQAMAQNPTQTATFKTPEDAVTLYMQGIAAGDVNKILQACAIDEMSKNFKFDAYVNRLQMFSPILSMAPANYPLYTEINKAQITADILRQVKIFEYSLLSSVDVASGNPIYNPDADTIAQFIKDVDPSRLSNIAVVKIGLPEPSLFNTPNNLDVMAKNALIYGADEATDRVALFTFEGNYYFVGFSLLRYGDSWKIRTETSAITNTPVSGAAIKTTASDFDALISK